MRRKPKTDIDEPKRAKYFVIVPGVTWWKCPYCDGLYRLEQQSVCIKCNFEFEISKAVRSAIDLATLSK